MSDAQNSTQQTFVVEVFVSKEGTQYIWERNKETIVHLSDLEVKLLQIKVSAMSDSTILNRTSGAPEPSGIPVQLHNQQLRDILDRLKSILAEGPLVDIEPHAISRLLEDALLPEGHPNKRGWQSQEEVEDCVYSAHAIQGVRLNVNHEHPDNTDKVKHLHTQFAIVIKGDKSNGEGRLVLVILDQNQLSVITIL